MPVMDGYQATREIRRLEKETGAAPTPVLALTAHAFADMAVKGCEAGFTDAADETDPPGDVAGGAGKVRTVRRTSARDAGRPEAALAPIRVQVEEGMEDVVPGYLEKRRAEVAVYRRRWMPGTSIPSANWRTR